MDIKDYDELSEFTELEGTELGEYCNSLLCIRRYHPSHGMSETFDKALEVELAHKLEMFKLHCQIVEKTEEPREPQKYKELEWLEWFDE